MPEPASLNKVTATPEAVRLLDEIIADHGPVLFHQSGGCCDGSSPMCYPRGDFIVGDRDVLLIDDILESGKTLKFVRELMLERGARSVSIAVLLDKSIRRKVDLHADFVSFECPDYFVVGYGMDVGHAFRQLPYVGRVME